MFFLFDPLVRKNDACRSGERRQASGLEPAAYTSGYMPGMFYAPRDLPVQIVMQTLRAASFPLYFYLFLSLSLSLFSCQHAQSP